MSEFTASNGVIVKTYATQIGQRLSALDQDPARVSGSGPVRVESYLDPRQADALREFIQHERDEELGRWRYPLDTWYVVYSYGRDVINVLSERNGSSTTHRREDVEACLKHPQVADSEIVARAFFESHPERKPWEDAKPGEAWVISEDGEPDRAYLVDDTQFYDSARDQALNFDDPSITAARRIWPEVAA